MRKPLCETNKYLREPDKLRKIVEENSRMSAVFEDARLPKLEKKK